jgi:hypothetical protein
MALEPDRGLAERLARMMRKAGEEALLELGEELKRQVIEGIPVEDPALDPDPHYQLRDHVEVRVLGNFVSVSVEGAYAVKQHERLSFRHPRGGEAKFLERPATRIAATMPGVLEGMVRRTFSTGKSFETGVG